MFPRTLDWKHHSPSACHTVLSLFGVKHFNSSKAWMKEKNPWSPFQVGVGSAWSVVRGQLAHPWASPSLPLFLNYETVQYIKHTLACSLQCQAGKIFFFIFFSLVYMKWRFLLYWCTCHFDSVWEMTRGEGGSWLNCVSVTQTSTCVQWVAVERNLKGCSPWNFDV